VGFLRSKSKLFKIKGANKAFLEILIAEVESCKDIAEVKAILETWKKANDLHPEKVQSMSEEQFAEWIKNPDVISRE